MLEHERGVAASAKSNGDLARRESDLAPIHQTPFRRIALHFLPLYLLEESDLNGGALFQEPNGLLTILSVSAVNTIGSFRKC